MPGQAYEFSNTYTNGSVTCANLTEEFGALWTQTTQLAPGEFYIEPYSQSDVFGEAFDTATAAIGLPLVDSQNTSIGIFGVNFNFTNLIDFTMASLFLDNPNVVSYVYQTTDFSQPVYEINNTNLTLPYLDLSTVEWLYQNPVTASSTYEDYQMLKTTSAGTEFYTVSSVVEVGSQQVYLLVIMREATEVDLFILTHETKLAQDQRQQTYEQIGFQAALAFIAFLVILFSSSQIDRAIRELSKWTQLLNKAKDFNDKQEAIKQMQQAEMFGFLQTQ